MGEDYLRLSVQGLPEGPRQGRIMPQGRDGVHISGERKQKQESKRIKAGGHESAGPQVAWELRYEFIHTKDLGTLQAQPISPKVTHSFAQIGKNSPR